MTQVRTISALVVGIICMGLLLEVYAQPNIAMERIPLNIPTDIKKQIEKLYSKDPLDRFDALGTLGKFGGRAAPAIPFLATILHDNIQVRTGSGIIFPGQELPLTSTTIGWEAAKTLVKIGKPAVEALITALRHEDSNVRERSAYALAKIRDPRAVEFLIARLNDEVLRIRSVAALALGEIGDPRAVEPLIHALKDEDLEVRMDVAEALGDIEDPRAVKPLIAALKDNDHEVRKVAA